MTDLSLAGRLIGLAHPTYFVADIAANHDGDLDRARKLIHLAAEAGADAAKFQNFKAETIVSDVGFRNLGSKAAHQQKWSESVYEVYDKASIPDDWTIALKEECDKAGIHYATSPYDAASVDLALPWTTFYKIGSGDITWLEICRYMAEKGKPVFLATGASVLEEVELAVNAILSINPALVLMQCNTNYTGSKGNFDFVNLRVLQLYAQKWPNLVLGFSDHTPGYSAVLGAVTLGARVVEKHFTDDNSRSGPDHPFSLTPQTWREMVDRTRELEAALGDGHKRIEENERETVVLQRRTLRAARDLPAGHIVCDEDLFPLRPAPADGFAPYRKKELLGRVLQKSVSRGAHITPDHL